MPGVMQSAIGTILVCEPRSFWAPALQREFEQSAFFVRGCRSLRDLPGLMDLPRGIVVCDVTVQPAEFLNWFATPASRRWPSLVCASPATAELEPVFRELGVRSFQTDFIAPRELARICRRWLGL
ncbi:MAG TPA: hypothetical protein VFG20_00370 [Planctomycetaceae bacterium]|nr:hypothetical protein [Planctomycetaceae bacterium]